MKRTWGTITALLLATGSVLGGDIVPPAAERFASEEVKEVPDFQKHILPMMGRAGCNGRACHGSFQGQGGFRLSLFGYDFKSDHEALTAGDSPRISLEVPLASKVLEKATEEIPHKGGKRFDVDSWQHRMLVKWIESGAKGVDEEGHKIKGLTVTPTEIISDGSSEPIQLKVLATWEDGTIEDVTCICRFRTNDESIAVIDEDGGVRVVGKGDTHVVAFYDNGVAVVPVMQPVSAYTGDAYPQVETPTKIDELVVQKLRKVGIVPSEQCTDEEFLRRVSLDITGTLPTPQEIQDFVADKSADKRSKKIDELLETPAYSAWWATKICDFTGNNTRNLDPTFRTEQASQWYEWVKARIAKNVPYDKLIEGMVVSYSRLPGQSYEDYCKEMVQYIAKDGKADFAERPTMPYFWTRRTIRTSDDKALNFAYAFLGVQLQCAQCHKHPFDQWTQQDFKQFTAFFDRINYSNRAADPEGRKYFAMLQEKLELQGLRGGEQRRIIGKAAREGQVVPLGELVVRPPRQQRRDRGNRNQVRGSRTITPKLLGGEEVVDGQYDDPRIALMEWMRHEDNPYFATAWVNRVWTSYFGVGIIEPADDQNLANPPSNKPLLDYLAKGFIESGFDMKWLHRTIANSATYQRSWRTNETNIHDTRNFSHAIVRRLPAEVAYDIVRQATANNEQVAQFRENLKDRAIAEALVGDRRGRESYALEVFGKPDRTTTCDCERSNEVNLVQSIFLRNDQELFNLMEQRDGWLREVSDRYDLDPQANKTAEGRKQRENLVSLSKQVEVTQRQLKRAREQKKEKQVTKLAAQLRKLQREQRELVALLKSDKEEQAESAKGPVLAKADQQQIVREAYLRTLSRQPRPEEIARACEHLESTPGIEGVRDLLWSLLNTKEFIVNH